MLAIVAVIALVTITLMCCGISASASSYDWDTYPYTPYLYYPINGSIQNDNINYEFAVDGQLNTYGNVPYENFETIYEGADEYVYGYSCGGYVDGAVNFNFSAFVGATFEAQYPSSLPTVTLSGTATLPTAFYYEIDYVFARPNSSGTLEVLPEVYAYYIELPEFDIEEAYTRFCSDESPVFPPVDAFAIITQISFTFNAVGDLYIELHYPYAEYAIESFPNVEFAPPDIDAGAIWDEAFQAGSIDGYRKGFDAGYSAIEDFNPVGWILNILEAVFEFELIPIGDGITVGMILSVLLVVPFAIWFLRLFAGG